MSDDKAFDDYITIVPSAYIQWKDTNVRMQFNCDCGGHCEFEGDFAYSVQCCHCQTVWEMPRSVFPRKADERTHEYWRDYPQLMKPNPVYEEVEDDC
jgi:hypothetical protein